MLAGTGAVHQVHAALREWGVRRGPRLVLTLVFGINPMVLYYAGNGMSDMLYMFLLVLTTRYFLRWLHHGGLRPLVYAGSALGLAYLDRYEALGAAGLAAVVVLGVSYWRSQDQLRDPHQGCGGRCHDFSSADGRDVHGVGRDELCHRRSGFSRHLVPVRDGRSDIRIGSDDICRPRCPWHPQHRVPCALTACGARSRDLFRGTTSRSPNPGPPGHSGWQRHLRHAGSSRRIP